MKYTALFLTAMFSTASLATTHWVTGSPYPGNPLKTATLQGEAQFGEQRDNAWLVLSCRPDSPPALLTLRVAGALLADFPLDDFEGPDAIGEHTPRVQVLSHEQVQTHSQAWTASGAWQESNFTWTITPTVQALNQWLHGKDHILRVVISQAAAGKPPLTARFTLPDEPRQAEQVLRPCGP
ncbi:hypothetical protein [Shimwellia blattae]|uniref:Uncharacterized protein n=1 Tax=Shimwellia blattae (strain ATCC 29907 / DSM 4481 / JCM 1650 / NBRC 105725 / CDC 9005-74) TaxID=630626 RepID=I2B476_SHIBC|nr:hypothetical protein [Shimwellia blattae]AFJ45330.1 hypothetical protein EBL_c01950 [Shimwellia blattae DSM 4481 = NBRC 105725]GAB80558.1 hypothetical protein EB105725_06_00240 [Shimwellia blattae DSM 4481 = NBRC 105725]VDY62811.1 Uncharacterised protein [Shimwellia blattae]VEC19677.1 Uncharacterised protein [Shimwellia blattae]